VAYAVAGATGRVGSAVARELLARGADVTVIVRDEARGNEWQRRGARLATGSLDDAAFLARTFEGADGAFVILPENVPPDDFHGTRRRMADAIASAARTAALPHVVMFSAIAAVAPDGNGPAKDLHYLERLLETRVSTATIARSCYFLDNIASVIAPAAAQGIYPNLLPSQDRAFPQIATRDAGRLAAELLLAGATGTTIVDLLGPSYSVRQLADALGAAIGRTLTIVDIPPAEHVPALTAAGVPRQLAEAVAEMLAGFAAGRFMPSAERRLHGTTTIEEVIAALLPRH
jgi:uncharacterized protein YbjT (DUF2867 family)